MTHSRSPWRIRFIILFGLLAVLTGCNYRQGWVEVTYSDRTQATYTLFNGQKEQVINLEAGEGLTLAYDLAIAKGSLTLQIVDPDRTVVWEGSFTETSTGDTSFTVANEGVYRLVISGNRTRGSFDLHWEITEND